MWRISAISDDWVGKGCHIHIDRVELAVRPNHLGGVIFERVFSSTRDADFEVAARIAHDLLGDAEFRSKLRDSIRRAMTYLLGTTGRQRPLARGRLREFKFLLVALDRLEAP